MVPSEDPLRSLRLLPDARTHNPSFDPRLVKTNVPKEQLTLALNVFSHFIWHRDAYAPQIGRRIMPVRFSVYRKEDGRVEAESVCEVVINDDMCNGYKQLAGGCAALMLDGCSASAIVLLGICLGQDTTGLSQSMHLVFHQSAPLGKTLRIVNTSISVGGRVGAGRTELYDKDTGQLLVSGVHTTVNARSAKLKSKI